MFCIMIYLWQQKTSDLGDEQTSRQTLRRNAFILKDIEGVLFTAAGVDILILSRITQGPEHGQIVL